MLKKVDHSLKIFDQEYIAIYSLTMLLVKGIEFRIKPDS